MSNSSSLSPAGPDFIIIGAAKAGTTSLASYLGQHPEVFVTDPKEPAHFTGRGDFADTSKYRSLFVASRPGQIAGEASTVYSRQAAFPGVPRRIHASAPAAQLVYLVRDPMARLRSHYLMRLRLGTTEGSFDAFCSRNDWYTDISCYGVQLRTYLEYFDAEQVHIARIEDLAADQTGVLRSIASHIGADPDFYHLDRTLQRLNVAPGGAPQRHRSTPRVLRATAKLLPKRARRRLKRRMPKTTVDETDLVLAPRTERRLRDMFAADQRLLAELSSSDQPWYAP
ncbi:MAG: sulfotransferase [Actinomycetota bacterium]